MSFKMRIFLIFVVCLIFQIHCTEQVETSISDQKQNENAEPPKKKKIIKKKIIKKVIKKKKVKKTVFYENPKWVPFMTVYQRERYPG